ncbi:MAG: 50S ribosomal protein L5 [Planctomycetes bacterium]|nr:50S ribosomal protein L5 [Planctomycetota bacterium]
MSDTSEQEVAVGQSYQPRLKALYEEEVTSALLERFGLENRLAVPRLEKIALNIGIGRAVDDASAVEDGMATLRAISGQQPAITYARRSVAGFHLREGKAIGCKVTLRRNRMYEFLDRLISVVLPRVRDFRGLSPDSFDGTGNYSLGMREVAVFPELALDSLGHIFGLDVTIVTSAGTDQEAFELLRMLGMPFRQ